MQRTVPTESLASALRLSESCESPQNSAQDDAHIEARDFAWGSAPEKEVELQELRTVEDEFFRDIFSKYSKEDIFRCMKTFFDDSNRS